MSAQQLRIQAARLLEEADRLDDEPEDDFEPGTVVVWERQFQEGGAVYSYAAVKYAEGMWAITGQRSGHYSWRTLWSTDLMRAVPGSVYWASELTPTEWQP